MSKGKCRKYLRHFYWQYIKQAVTAVKHTAGRLTCKMHQQGEDIKPLITSKIEEAAGKNGGLAYK